MSEAGVRIKRLRQSTGGGLDLVNTLPFSKDRRFFSDCHAAAGVIHGSGKLKNHFKDHSDCSKPKH